MYKQQVIRTNRKGGVKYCYTCILKITTHAASVKIYNFEGNQVARYPKISVLPNKWLSLRLR